jgi:hypothetical protein
MAQPCEHNEYQECFWRTGWMEAWFFKADIVLIRRWCIISVLLISNCPRQCLPSLSNDETDEKWRRNFWKGRETLWVEIQGSGSSMLWLCAEENDISSNMFKLVDIDGTSFKLSTNLCPLRRKGLVWLDEYVHHKYSCTCLSNIFDISGFRTYLELHPDRGSVCRNARL